MAPAGSAGNVHVSGVDIGRMAKLGFDHVRLPIHSRALVTDNGDLREDGFAHIDRVIESCEQHGLWLLLDLHAAPRTWTRTDLDESPNSEPGQCVEESRHRSTITLWCEIARRYRDRTTVLGLTYSTGR